MSVGGVVYRPLVGRTVLGPVVRWGHGRYRRTGTTPTPAYVAMRRLHGSAPDVLDALERRFARDPDADRAPTASGPEGLATGAIDDLVATLDRDGCSVLPRRLDEGDCAELEQAARSAPTTAIGGADDVPPGPVDLDRPRAPRYDLDEEDVLAIPAAQRLVADPSLLAVARGYLRAEPVQDLVTMWWTTAVERFDADAAAQRFHFDMDRLRFLKVFVYLTDVTEETGPHVYAVGSHRPEAVPPALRRDGRHDDDAVARAFGADVRRICGPRGTVFLADTRGLHKGESVRTGHRLVLQTEYATSLFGAPTTRPRIAHPTPELRAAVAAHPATFSRFVLAP
ncbi:MAG TPA: phytanoyl-CoA dioxygenase family protein [Iamia sp.]